MASVQTTEEQDIALHYSTRSLLRETIKFLRPFPSRFALATVSRIIADLSWLYPSFALATIITILTEGDTTRYSQLITIFIFWILASIGRYGGLTVTKLVGFRIAEQVSINAQLATIRHLFHLDAAWHEKENAGNKLKKIERGGAGLNRIIRIWYNNIIEITVNFIGITFIVSTFDLMTSLILLGFISSYMIASSLLTKKASVAHHHVNLQEEDMHGLSFEAINNIRSVKVMSMADTLYKKLNHLSKELYRRIKRRILWFQMRSMVQQIIGQIFRLGAIIYIILGIIQGRYEVGFLVLFYTYFNRIWESVDELATVSQDLIVAKLGVARMSEVLNEPIRIDSNEGKKLFPKQWSAIRLHNVSFSYGNRRVLNSLSFAIQRGEKIGIVGLSGAGKSTLFKLLLKEYENFSGTIDIENVPIQTIDKKDYFNNVAVVLQDTEVFNFTLRDNITISNPQQVRNKKLLSETIEIAHVSDFVKRLPNGLDTYIGEKGIKLSGGEKQRVGIARALFKQPQLVLLDEATSHLDIESEEKIRDSLHHFFKNITAIVIAHRLTTIRQMDRIIVIEDGSIVETGNFDALYAQRGRFFELWEKQRL